MARDAKALAQMTRSRLTRHAALVLPLVVAVARPAGAVRPFVTDDARIVSRGQLEVEMWPELVLARGEAHPGYHAMGGVSVTEWFEVIAGGGFGIGPRGELTIANPVVLPKFLIWRAEDNGIPGLALSVGLTLPFGRGRLFDDATGTYAAALLTSRFFDDWLLVHANVGWLGARRSGEGGSGNVSTRPYWGGGFDLGVGHPDARLVGEAYAGDPLQPLGAKYAFQWGGRWLASDFVNIDLTFGAQPLVEDDVRISGEWELWSQVGIRLLFDVFTDGPGDPLGAFGAMRAPGAPRRGAP